MLILATSVFGCAQLGEFLAVDESPTKADAIFVFAGSKAERQLEAVDLYRAGYAPVIVLTQATEEPALAELTRRGVTLPTQFSMARDILRQLGVPEAAVIAPARVHDNTAQEAATLRELAAARGWRRVILVSSRYHMRRVGMAARRALRGLPVEVVLKASRYDPAEPPDWWRRRADIRQILWEVPKLVGYAAGVGE